MSRASNLFRLQEVDLALDQARERLAEIKQTLADDENLERAQEISDRSESELRSVRADNLSAEHAVESQRTKIKEVEELLYSGVVTNPKELQDRQQEAESLKRHLSTLEDRLLEEMMRLEDAEQSYQLAQKKLQEIELSRSVQHQTLFEEREKLRREVERLEGEREAALAGTPGNDLALYDDLRSRYGGRAVALISDNGCSACGMELARSVPQAASNGSELVRCPQCSRILYVG
jgi:predicted  nucleic acid-binding Zn-ribbon protein